jgi:hypothetical protein
MWHESVGRVYSWSKALVCVGIVAVTLAGASFHGAKAQEPGTRPRPDCAGASAESARQALSDLRASRLASPTARVIGLRNRFAEKLSATGCFDLHAGRVLSVRDDVRAAASLLSSDARFARSTVALLEGIARDARIWGGRPQKGFSAVVALFRAGASKAQCTGVLIASDTVLTAGHCVCGGVTDRIAAVPNTSIQGNRFRIDPNRIDYRVDCNAYRSDRGRNSLKGKDVAILRLKDPVPATVVSARRIATSDMISDAGGQVVRAVGYGLTESGYTPQKMEVDLPIASPSCRSGADARRYACMPGAEMVAGAYGLQRDTCKGYSGGPIFVWNRRAQDWFLVGLTSRAVPGTYCGDGGIYSLLGDSVLVRLRDQGVRFGIGRTG